VTKGDHGAAAKKRVRSGCKPVNRLPVTYCVEGGALRAIRAHRRGTGMTTMKVSRATLRLLRILADRSRPEGVTPDDVLFFDVIERLDIEGDIRRIAAGGTSDDLMALR
jgi:hypothetical protein